MNSKDKVKVKRKFHSHRPEPSKKMMKPTETQKENKLSKTDKAKARIKQFL